MVPSVQQRNAKEDIDIKCNTKNVDLTVANLYKRLRMRGSHRLYLRL